MKGIYPVLIKESGSDYLVFVPDLDLYTEGKDMQDAFINVLGLKQRH